MRDEHQYLPRGLDVVSTYSVFVVQGIDRVGTRGIHELVVDKVALRWVN